MTRRHTVRRLAVAAPPAADPVTDVRLPEAERLGALHVVQKEPASDDGRERAQQVQRRLLDRFDSAAGAEDLVDRIGNDSMARRIVDDRTATVIRRLA